MPRQDGACLRGHRQLGTGARKRVTLPAGMETGRIVSVLGMLFVSVFSGKFFVSVFWSLVFSLFLGFF